MNKNKLSTVRGMHDLYGEDHTKQQSVIDNFIKTVTLFNFTPINTPIMEHSDVFLRTLGNSSDVVTKEMYSFKDRNDDELCLTPEGTASCMRLAFENNLIYDRGIKKNRLYYYAPMFRHERPQKGRLRQFNQFGLEYFGFSGISSEIELIVLINKLFS